MHNERDPHTSYRVEVAWPANSELLTYAVTIYPPIEPNNTATVGSTYREDVVPEWMRVAMDMLDIAAVGGTSLIPFFGSKAGNIYWFMATQTQEGYDGGRNDNKEG